MKRDWQGPNICVLCAGKEETIDHLFHITRISERSCHIAGGCMYYNFLQLQNIFGNLRDIHPSIKTNGLFEI